MWWLTHITWQSAYMVAGGLGFPGLGLHYQSHSCSWGGTTAYKAEQIVPSLRMCDTY